jgi:hypothetical protein
MAAIDVCRGKPIGYTHSPSSSALCWVGESVSREADEVNLPDMLAGKAESVASEPG